MRLYTSCFLKNIKVHKKNQIKFYYPRICKHTHHFNADVWHFPVYVTIIMWPCHLLRLKDDKRLIFQVLLFVIYFWFHHDCSAQYVAYKFIYCWHFLFNFNDFKIEALKTYSFSSHTGPTPLNLSPTRDSIIENHWTPLQEQTQLLCHFLINFKGIVQ